MGNGALSQLDLKILDSISKEFDLATIARAAKVSQATVGMRIAKLQLSGHIGDDGHLTIKGKDALTVIKGPAD